MQTRSNARVAVLGSLEAMSDRLWEEPAFSNAKVRVCVCAETQTQLALALSLSPSCSFLGWLGNWRSMMVRVGAAGGQLLGRVLAWTFQRRAVAALQELQVLDTDGTPRHPEAGQQGTAFVPLAAGTTQLAGACLCPAPQPSLMSRFATVRPPRPYPRTCA
jgi:hypothetical protein